MVTELDWGLVWFDNSDSPLRQKTLDAATAYRVKNKRWPNLCYVNPSELPDGKPALFDGVRVVALDTVLKHHFWIGIAKGACNHTANNWNLQEDGKTWVCRGCGEVMDEEAAKTANS